MRLFADGANPEDIGEETGRPEDSAERACRAKILLDSIKARGVNKAEIATSIGYSSYNSIRSSINSGHMGVRRYEKLVRLAGEILNNKKAGEHSTQNRSTLRNSEKEVKQSAAPDIPHGPRSLIISRGRGISCRVSSPPTGRPSKTRQTLSPLRVSSSIHSGSRT